MEAFYNWMATNSNIFLLSFCMLSAVLLTFAGRKIMQILQLSSYRVRGVCVWFKTSKGDWLIRYFALAFFAFVSMLVYVGCFARYKYVRYLGLLFYILLSVLFICITNKQKQKTPLAYTPRIMRLIVLSGLLFGAATFGVMRLDTLTPVRYAFVGLLPLFTPFIILLAHGILWPFETLNNYGYVRKAQKKLQTMPELLKIGITGSYGKTTTKNILAAMLSAKYNVLFSPSSYNTPLGIARVVNYDLTTEHNVLIAEMGARRKGDIAELCGMVKPDVGIVTGVGNQHLATFGTVENIAATKYELIEGLAPDGIAVFSSDNAYTREMYEHANVKKHLAGAKGTADSDVTYDSVAFSPDGTSFTLAYGGNKASVTTKLLGRHVPSLIALCASAALALGVEWNAIVAAAESLEQVPHRLEQIRNGDVTVLDDAYNSNEQGAKNALEVLKAFGGVRMVITPGLVELGDAEESANTELGRLVAESADYAYFVGARAEFLKKGAVTAGMDENRVFMCASLTEAVQKTAEIAGVKTILFENDLPDNL